MSSIRDAGGEGEKQQREIWGVGSTALVIVHEERDRRSQGWPRERDRGEDAASTGDLASR